MGYRSSPVKSAWLWLIIIGIVIILISVIIRLAQKKFTNLFWGTLAVGAFFFILGIVLLIFWIRKPNKEDSVKEQAKVLQASQR